LVVDSCFLSSSSRYEKRCMLCRITVMCLLEVEYESDAY